MGRVGGRGHRPGRRFPARTRRGGGPSPRRRARNDTHHRSAPGGVILTHHTFNGHDLIVTLCTPVTLHQRTAWLAQTEELLESLRPACLVIELPVAAATAAAVSAVLRAHHVCARRTVAMAVATLSASACHLLRSNSPSLPVHGHVGDALRAAHIQLRRGGPRNPPPS
jgi:hypothetical protein